MKKWPRVRLQIKKIIASSLSVVLLFSSINYIVAHASESSVNISCNYVNLLNQQQQDVYHQVHNAILEYDTALFPLITPLSEQQLEDTMVALFNDHPELFWVNTSYKYGVDSSGIVHKIQLNFAIEQDRLSQVKSEYSQVVNSIVSEASNYGDIVEKERFIYDKICSMNSYDSGSRMSQSSYSALTSGTSVCAGYARAFQLICNKCDIPCYYITGESKGQSHAWNVVIIDDTIYNVDLTWDDCIADATGGSSYNYFNKNDLEFSSNHSRSDLSSKLVTALALR